jgi:CheY-like chemotaxis protein/nitrogen-specific signal transduction histidine kinase
MTLTDHVSESGDDGRTAALMGELARETRIRAEVEARIDALGREIASRDEFMAMLSHELRSPLGAVLGWTQLLRSGALDERKAAEAVNRILRGARVAARLVDSLLDGSRIVLGAIALDRQSLDVTAIANDVVQSAQPSAWQRLVTVRMEGTTTIPVFGDPLRIRQIVENLVSNAIKFSCSPGLVTVRVRRVDSNAVLTVEDGGCGIAPEHLPRVFDRFHQGDSNRGGLGLGLFIARGLAELHAGRLSAESAGLDRGATFTLTLPLSANGPVSEHDSSGMLPISFQGLRILVVEDDPDAVCLLSEILQSNGATITAVSSAEEAFRCFLEVRPSMVVADLQLPGIDGVAMLQVLREMNEGPIPAIAVSALTREADRVRARDAGFSMCVTKPFAVTGLLNAIAAVASELE